MSQAYILTLFRADIQQTWKNVHQQLWDSGFFLYIGSQLERTQDGRLHWQAFVKFQRDKKQKKTWFHSNNRCTKGCHAEVCNTERSQAINYGTKEESRIEGPMESGEKPTAAAKGAQWNLLKQQVLDDDKENVDFGMIVRYNLERRWEALQKFYWKDERLDLPVWLPNPWGKLLPVIRPEILIKKKHYWIFSRMPNKGKTFFFAKPLSEKYKCHLQTGNFTSWNVNKGIKCVILDEYNSAALKYYELNAMCDGTYGFKKLYKDPFSLPNTLIIVLSNQSLSELYPYMNHLMYERFNEIELI